jgi:hypothetical protein
MHAEGEIESIEGVDAARRGLEYPRRSNVRGKSIVERKAIYAERQARYRARARKEINARNREWMRRVRADIKARREAARKGEGQGE